MTRATQLNKTQIDEIVHLYTVEGLGLRKIGQQIEAHHRVIKRVLQERDVTIRKWTGDKYSIRESAFDSLEDKEACYWLGFLYADGCVYKDTLTVMLSADDADHLKKMERFLGTERPLYYQEHTGFGGHTALRVNFRVRSNHLSERLRDLGIAPGRLDIALAVGHMPGDNFRHFIRGYFDGDGSARKSRAGIRFAGNEDTLIWLRVTLAQLAGTNPSLKLLRYKHTSKIQSVEYNGSHEAMKVVRFMYQDATIYMERKRAKIDSWPAPFMMRRDKLGRIYWEREEN